MKLSLANDAKHVLVFGPPKSGKTLLLGKLAEEINGGFNLKWFDLENGRATLLHNLSKEAQDRIELFPIPDTKDFPIAAETLALVLKGGLQRICHLHGKVSCSICLKTNPNGFSEIDVNKLTPRDILVFDSATQWTNSVQSSLVRGKPIEYRPDWDEYRTEKNMLDWGLTIIQNAPFHFAITSHEMGLEMEDDKEKLVPVFGTKNYSRTVAKYFSDVVYCEVKNIKHVAASSTLYAQNVLTGSRSNVAIEKDKEISLAKIFAPTQNPMQSQASSNLLQIQRELKP